MSITLTSRAVAQIKELMEENDLEDHVVRVSVTATPGEGLDYQLDIVDDVRDNDRRFETGGVPVVCDPASYLYAKGATVDFSPERGGFSFDNPRET